MVHTWWQVIDDTERIEGKTLAFDIRRFADEYERLHYDDDEYERVHDDDDDHHHHHFFHDIQGFADLLTFNYSQLAQLWWAQEVCEPPSGLTLACGSCVEVLRIQFF